LLVHVAAAAILLGGPTLPQTLGAQSAHVVSVQVSAMVLNSSIADGDQFSSYGGNVLGGEGQIRLSPGGRLSVGAGYQLATLRTGVSTLTQKEFTNKLSVIFVEPRYVIGNTSFASIYVAGRVGSGKVTCEPADVCDLYEAKAKLAFGGGGGLLIHLGGVALEGGVQYFRFSGADQPGFVFLRAGLSIGL